MIPSGSVASLDTAVKTRILIVDDHTTFAELLAGSLDREPDLCSIGFAVGVASAIELCRRLVPDVVVMDFHLSDGSGLDAAAAILTAQSHIRIVMLTGDPTPAAVERAAAIGVCAFLPKDGSLAVMLETLRHARSGSFMLHPALVPQLASSRVGHAPPGPRPTLSPREMDVLRLMSSGNDVRSNARTLSISESTCRGYVKSVLAKLDAHSQLEAVAAAARLGLLPAREHG